MIVVDSAIWIDYFKGVDTAATDKLNSILGVESLAVGDVILMEVLQGFRHEADYKKAKQLMMSMEVFEMLGEDAAIHCADNYRLLRKKGYTIRKSIDVVIATFCIRNGYPLLFQDRDFPPFVEHLGLTPVLKST